MDSLPTGAFVNCTCPTPRSYKELAKHRRTCVPYGYKQPEDFDNYDFGDCVSPYTKGAHRRGGIALVLQDWASEDGLNKTKAANKKSIAKLGRNPYLKTNKNLQILLDRVFGASLENVYATNAFPYVKPGGMSAPVSQRLVNSTAQRFTVPELLLAKPTLILALGRSAYIALQGAGVPDVVPLPHPAARLGSMRKHEQAWWDALNKYL